MMPVSHHMKMMDQLQPHHWRQGRPRSRLSYRYARRNEAKGYRCDYRMDFGRKNLEAEEEYIREHRRKYYRVVEPYITLRQPVAGLDLTPEQVRAYEDLVLACEVVANRTGKQPDQILITRAAAEKAGLV